MDASGFCNVKQKKVIFVITTLLKFLGPANPKNTGQRPLTQNFWVVVKFWFASILGSKNLGQRKILGHCKNFGSTKISASKNFG